MIKTPPPYNAVQLLLYLLVKAWIVLLAGSHPPPGGRCLPGSRGIFSMIIIIMMIVLIINIIMIIILTINIIMTIILIMINIMMMLIFMINIMMMVFLLTLLMTRKEGTQGRGWELSSTGGEQRLLDKTGRTMWAAESNQDDDDFDTKDGCDKMFGMIRLIVNWWTQAGSEGRSPFRLRRIRPRRPLTAEKKEDNEEEEEEEGQIIGVSSSVSTSSSSEVRRRPLIRTPVREEENEVSQDVVDSKESGEELSSDEVLDAKAKLTAREKARLRFKKLRSGSRDEKDELLDRWQFIYLFIYLFIWTGDNLSFSAFDSR